MKDTKTINFLGVSLLSLLMLVYTTVLQFSIPSVVLCFGDDGHIAFEQSDANFNCVDINEDSNLPVSNTPDLIGQSDDCQDIPLLNVLSTLYLEKDTKIKIKLDIIDENVNIINISTFSHFERNHFYTVIHPSMKSLQATILLI